MTKPERPTEALSTLEYGAMNCPNIQITDYFTEVTLALAYIADLETRLRLVLDYHHPGGKYGGKGLTDSPCQYAAQLLPAQEATV